jgi:hypothetical protein
VTAALQKTPTSSVVDPFRHTPHRAKLMVLLKANGLDDVLVVMVASFQMTSKLQALGIKGCPSGAPMQGIIDFIEANVRSRAGAYRVS